VESEGFGVTGLSDRRRFSTDLSAGNRGAARHRRIAYILVDALRWNCEGTARSSGRGFYRPDRVGDRNGSEHYRNRDGGVAASAASGLHVGGGNKAQIGKLQVTLHGEVLKNRADRVAYLKDRAGVPVVT